MIVKSKPRFINYLPDLDEFRKNNPPPEGDVVDFCWWRPIGGWRAVRARRKIWLKDTGELGGWETFPCLVPNYRDQGVKIYRPKKSDEIYTKVPWTNSFDDLAAFVDQWGAPGYSGRKVQLVDAEDIRSLGLHSLGGEAEPIVDAFYIFDDGFSGALTTRIADIRRRMLLWRAINNENRDEYMQLADQIADRQRAVLPRIKTPDKETNPKEFAINVLVKDINANLKPGIAGGGFSLDYFEVRSRPFRLSVVPEDLLQYCELEIALNIAGGTELRKCSSCPRPVAIPPDRRKRHKQYCSPACKMRAYRATKEPA